MGDPLAGLASSAAKKSRELQAEVDRLKAELTTLRGKTGSCMECERLQRKLDYFGRVQRDDSEAEERLLAESAKLRELIHQIGRETPGGTWSADLFDQYREAVDSMNGWTTDDENAREAWRAAVGGGEAGDGE